MNQEIQAKILTAFREAKKDGENEDNSNAFEFPWSSTVTGSDGRALYVHERSDRPGSVRVRWQATEEEARERDGVERPNRSVRLKKALRDERGRLRTRSKRGAEAAAQRLYEEWLESAQAATRSENAPWTLREGFAYAENLKTGIVAKEDWRKFLFAKEDDENKVSVSCYQIIDRIIGLDKQTWADWTLEDSRAVWRTLAEESEDGSGARVAEQVVGAIYSIADHLRSAGKIEEKDCLRPPKWRRTLKDEWQGLTGHSVEPVRQRYEQAEMSALIQGFRKTEDVLLRTAGMYGVGFRRAHVVRVRRSDLDLGTNGTYGAGQLDIPGGRRKGGGTIDLTPAMRLYFEQALSYGGYLGELEAAFQAGEIRDYYLLPGGRLRTGKGQVCNHKRHLHKDELYNRFLKMEEAVGVEHRDGRGWHALRRSLSDEISDETTDETARDMAQGWTPGGGTRVALYLDKEREEKRQEGTVARNAALRRLAQSDGAPDIVASSLESTRGTLKSLEALTQQQPELDLTEAIAAARSLVEALQVAGAQVAGLPTPTVEPPQTTEKEDHESIAQSIRDEIGARGITGRAAAEIMGTSPSDVSAIIRGKSHGIVATARLAGLLDALRSHQESGGDDPHHGPQAVPDRRNPANHAGFRV